MQNLNTTITELVCTRISHDLIGNIGAVSNAVELFEDGDDDFLDDIKSILKTSSFVLSSRLKFFRMAFGLDNSNTSNLESVAKVCENYLKTLGNPNTPIILDFKLDNPHYAKISMLGIMVLADSIVRGGEIKVFSKDGKIIVCFEKGTRFSEEKFAKIKELAQRGDIENNAQFAPLYYLLSLLSEQEIKFYVINSDLPGLVFE